MSEIILPDGREALDATEAVMLGAKDFIAFGHIFFPKTFRQASPQMHRDMGLRLYSQTRQNLFLVFRDGAKTTILRTFCAQRIGYAISRTIMFVSASQEHSIHSIRWLKKAVERNQLFSSTFGLRPGSKWTDEWIEVVNEVAGETINIIAAGITGQIRGFNLDDFRPDLIVADDILTEESTKTEEQREKMENLFHGALVNSLQAATEAPHAKVVLLQTPFHDQDLAMKCSRDPAWNPTVYGILDEKGESRWPEKFPTADIIVDRDSAILQGRKRMWMREKMCKVIKSEDVTLNSDLLKYWKVKPEGTINFISIDPASSNKKKADDNVVMCIGVQGPDVYVFGYQAAKGVDPGQAAAQFFDLVLRHPPILRAGVEAVAYQRTLKWYIEKEMRERGLFVPFELIEDKRSKADRILQQIPGLLAYGHLHIHASMNTLITQMDEYDPRVEDQPDDILDALAMAIRLAGPLIQSAYTIDGAIREVDEKQYKDLKLIGGCP